MVSCRQLKEMTCQFANALKTQGVKKGDRVVLYMPMIPLAVAAIMGCIRIGAIHRSAYVACHWSHLWAIVCILNIVCMYVHVRYRSAKSPKHMRVALDFSLNGTVCMYMYVCMYVCM